MLLLIFYCLCTVATVDDCYFIGGVVVIVVLLLYCCCLFFIVYVLLLLLLIVILGVVIGFVLLLIVVDFEILKSPLLFDVCLHRSSYSETDLFYVSLYFNRTLKTALLFISVFCLLMPTILFSILHKMTVSPKSISTKPFLTTFPFWKDI